ncbi:hypothetical protein EMCRGX_G006031 [Ephydatia muelleri]
MRYHITSVHGIKALQQGSKEEMGSSCSTSTASATTSVKEEVVDGETLELLAKCGTIEQYKACGLRSIKQQMQLKRLLNTDKRELEGSSSLEREMSSKKIDRKLKLLELRTISPEDRRIYLMTRNKINKATKEVWSGNDVPKFRGNEEEMKKLDKLVSDLLPICSCKYFGPQSIRQHILDSLQERRRKIKNGHDYRKNKKPLLWPRRPGSGHGSHVGGGGSGQGSSRQSGGGGTGVNTACAGGGAGAGAMLLPLLVAAALLLLLVAVGAALLLLLVGALLLLV